MVRMERKDIEEEDRKFVGKSEYGGRSNWDTYETALILDSDESSYKRMEAFSEDFNRKLRNGTFDMNKAEYAVKKYLIPEARKGDPDIDPSKVNTRELVREIVKMKEPLSPRKKDYVPNGSLNLAGEYGLKQDCESRNMEYVPGYRKEDGTVVRAFCCHTKFTGYMNGKRRR